MKLRRTATMYMCTIEDRPQHGTGEYAWRGVRFGRGREQHFADRGYVVEVYSMPNDLYIYAYTKTMACHFSPQLSCGNSCFPLIHSCSPPKAIDHLTRSTQTRQVQRLVIRARPPGRRLAARLQVYLPVLALELAGEEVELPTPLAVRRRDDSIACACEDRIGPSHPVSIVLLTCSHSHATYLRAPNR